MGDTRYDQVLRRFLDASDRLAALRAFADDEVVQALAAQAAEGRDPGTMVVANVLATEALNRVRRAGAVVRSVGEGILALNAQGEIVFANPSFLDLVRMKPEDLAWRDGHTVLHADAPEGHRADPEACVLLRTLRTGERLTEPDALIRDTEGLLLPVSLTVTPIERDGVVEGAVVVVRDERARKAADARREARLRVVEALVHKPTIEQAAPHILASIGRAYGWLVGVLWMPEQDGRLRARSIWTHEDLGAPAFLEATRTMTFPPGKGVPGRVWLTREPFWSTDFGALDEDHYPRVHHAREGGLVGVYAFPCPVAGEPRAVVEFFGRDRRTPGTELVEATIAVGGEIGAFIERVMGERRVRESEARVRGMLEAALDAIVMIDDQGRVIEFNPAAERLLGYARDEMMGKHLADTMIPERFREAHRRGIARFNETGEGPILGKLLRLPAVHKSGTEIEMELYIVRIQLGEGHVFTSAMRPAAAVAAPPPPDPTRSPHP